MVHVARTTPPHLAFGSLESFDSDVRMCFSNCVATDISDVAWKQAQLGLSYSGLGLRSISHHSCAAYIASLAWVVLTTLTWCGRLSGTIVWSHLRMASLWSLF